MEHTGIWSRVGGWFRGVARSSPNDSNTVHHQSAMASRDNPHVGVLEMKSAAAATLMVDEVDDPIAATPGVRENMTPEQPPMADQLHTQNRLLEEILQAMTELSRTVTQWETQSRSSADVVSKMHASMQGGAEAVRRLEESLNQLPRVADAQREALVTVSRQLDLMRESGEATTSAVGSLEQRSLEQTAAIQTAASAINSSWERTEVHQKVVTNALDRQTRRMTWLGITAVSLAGAALIIAVLALVI